MLKSLLIFVSALALAVLPASAAPFPFTVHNAIGECVVVYAQASENGYWAQANIEPGARHQFNNSNQHVKRVEVHATVPGHGMCLHSGKDPETNFYYTTRPGAQLKVIQSGNRYEIVPF